MIVILGKEIPLYGICFFVGIFIAVIVAFIIVKRQKLDLFDFACSSIYILIGSLIGAKLLFVVVSIETIIAYQLTFFEVIKGGFVFYGGLFGGYLGALIYGKQFKIEMSRFIDVFAIVLPLGHALGRIGCFFSGCCYGVEYDGIFSHVYHQAHNALTPLNVPLFPVQLFESALLFLLFCALLFIYLKGCKRSIPKNVYLISYAIIRFTLEFLRGDSERGGVLGLATSQWISLLIIVVVVGRTIYKKIKNKKKVL